MNINDYLNRLVIWLKITKDRLSVFLRKHHDAILVILLPLAALLIAQLFLRFLLRISPLRFFWLILYYTTFLILSYIYLSYKNKISWVNRHAIFLTFLGILIPIILFLWQQVATESRVFLNYEVAIKEENNRNNSYLQSIITDLSNDPNTVFWRDFSLRSYTELWNYIHLNKSQECKDLYATLTIQLGVLNNINRMRQELILVPNNLYDQMLDTASSTKPILDLIVGKCQSV